MKVAKYEANNDDQDDDGITNLCFQSICWMNKASNLRRYRRVAKIIFWICCFTEHALFLFIE